MMNLREYRVWIESGAPINWDIIELDIRQGSQETVDFYPIYNIEKVNNLPMLQKLNCSYNSIRRIDHLNLKYLRELNCSYNNICDITNLCSPVLSVINCDYNCIQRVHITQSNLPELAIFRCKNNPIITYSICSNKLREFIYMNI